MARKKGVPQRAGLSRAEFEQVKQQALTSTAFEEEQRDEEERRAREEQEDRRRAEEHVRRIRADAEARTRAAQLHSAFLRAVVAVVARSPPSPHLAAPLAVNAGKGPVLFRREQSY